MDSPSEWAGPCRSVRYRANDKVSKSCIFSSCIPSEGMNSLAEKRRGGTSCRSMTIQSKHQEPPIQPDTGHYPSPAPDLTSLMMLYQRGDATAVTVLVESLSPQLYWFFASQMGSRTDAEDMLQDVWLRIHRVRHTYRPSEPLLPWVYAIARRVRVDSYRKRQRIASRETSAYALPELPANEEQKSHLPPFEALVASLSESQREVLTMLKVNGLSNEEVARATSSTVGAVKQKAHRAYERLRFLLERAPREGASKAAAQ
jgi:RNA polymerase sigma-70 factor (ECF subfamily)